MRRLLPLLALLLAGCGAGETAISKEEEARFGGTKPPPEVLAKLQGRTPPSSGDAPR